MAGPRARRVRLAPWQGLAHLLAVILAVGLARFAVFDVVQFLVGDFPNDAHCAVVLVLPVACSAYTSICTRPVAVQHPGTVTG